MSYLSLDGLTRFYAGIKSRYLLKANVANNLTTTAAGKALDARQGKALKDSVDALSTAKAATALYTATLTTTWTGSGPWTQTVNVSGILATDTPMVDAVLSDTAATAQAQLEAWGCVSRIVTGAGTITATCLEEMPVTAIPIQLKVVR